MSKNHESFIQTAEREALQAYASALTHVRDDIEHASSKTIMVVQGWLDDTAAKLKELEDAEGKPAAGGASSGSPSAAKALSVKLANAGNTASAEGVKEPEEGDGAQKENSAKAEAGASTQDNAKSAA